MKIITHAEEEETNTMLLFGKLICSLGEVGREGEGGRDGGREGEGRREGGIGGGSGGRKGERKRRE